MAVGKVTQTGSGSSDHLRRHNLSGDLGLTPPYGRLSQPSSTKQTGLKRSTIAALVAELVDRQLVVETEQDSSEQVGRGDSHGAA